MLLLLLASGAAADLATVRELADAGRSSEALAELERQIRGRRPDMEEEFLRGVLLARVGRTTEAEALFLELSQRLPEDPAPLNNLAAIAVAAGEYEAALELLKRALRTDPGYATAYENLVRVSETLASQAYERALGGEPNSQQVQLALLTELGAGAMESEARGRQIAATTPALPPRAMVEAPAGPEPGQQPVSGPAAPGDDEALDRPGVTPAKIDTAGAAATVQAWAEAWSAQDVERYLAFYADGFRPPDDLSLPAWREQRRQRLTEPEFVRVSVKDMRVEAEARRTSVRFVQDYESNRLSSRVLKVLDLVWEDGGWRILEERVEG